MRHATPRPGIYYGWFIVATTFLMALVTVGARSGFGVFVLPMSEDFGWNRSTISLAAAIGALVSGFSQPFLGRLYDRLGGRTLFLVSLLSSGTCTMLLALTNHIVFLIVLFGVVMAIAIGGSSLTTTSALLSKWFRRQRATAMALNAAGASIGGLLLVPCTVYLISLVGWRTTWVVLGLMILVLVVPPVYFLLKDDPADLGLLPDGDPQPSDASPGPVRPGILEAEYWLDSFRSVPMWQLCGGYFVCGFTIALISTHFVPYAIERGFSPATAGTAFGLMSGLNVVGVIAVGALSDRLGRKNILGLVYALRGCAYAALLLLPGHWGLWGFAVIVGFSWWATLPLTGALTAEVYGLKHLGILNGIIFTGHQIGGALSIQFGGVMRDLTGSYELPFTVAALLLFGASAASLSIQEKRYSTRYQAVSGSPAPYAD